MGLFGMGKKPARPGVAVLESETPTPAPEAPAPAGPTPDQALAELRAGNEAFLRGENNLGYVKVDDLEPLQGGQNPIATIVGVLSSASASSRASSL